MKTYILVSAVAVLMALFSFTVADEQRDDSVSAAVTPIVEVNANNEMFAGWFDELWRKVTPTVEEPANNGMTAGWFDELWRRVTPTV